MRSRINRAGTAGAAAFVFGLGAAFLATFGDGFGAGVCFLTAFPFVLGAFVFGADFLAKAFFFRGLRTGAALRADFGAVLALALVFAFGFGAVRLTAFLTAFLMAFFVGFRAGDFFAAAAFFFVFFLAMTVLPLAGATEGRRPCLTSGGLSTDNCLLIAIPRDATDSPSKL